MLGDSVRRRQKIPKPRTPRGPASGRRWVPLKVWLPALIAAITVSFAIGYAIAVLVLFPAPEVHGLGIPVPELVGLEVDRARERLRAVGLGGLDVTELPNLTRPRGFVTAQTPLPRQELRAGAVVRVAVSSGPPRVIVPDVVGFSADRAADLLTRLGFDVERSIEDSDEPSDRVIGVNPAAGTDLELPARIAILISAGPPDVPVDTFIRPDTLLRVDTLVGGGREGNTRPVAGDTVVTVSSTKSIESTHERGGGARAR